MKTEKEIRAMLKYLVNRTDEIKQVVSDEDKRDVPVALNDATIYALRWVLDHKNITIGWNYCCGCGILHKEPTCPQCKGFVYHAWERKDG